MTQPTSKFSNLGTPEMRKVLYETIGNSFAAHIQKETRQMRQFLKDVLSMSPRKYNKYWRRRLFSGKGHPPVEITSDKKTIDYVKKTDGAIGIIGKVPKNKEEDLYFFKASGDGHSLENVK